MAFKCKIGLHDYSMDFAKCSLCNKLPNSGKFIDIRDGNKYKWVRIGNQIWMAENLRYNVEFDGTKNSKYGYLYTKYALKELAPNGWHIPSYIEFENLLTNYEDFDTAYNELIFTGKSGFNALLGGHQSYYSPSITVGEDIFWAELIKDAGWCLILDNRPTLGGKVRIASHSLENAYSVRCVKDKSTEELNRIKKIHETKVQQNEVFIDSRDGNQYKTIQVGNQIIMAENLRYKMPMGCVSWRNDSSNDNKYGCFYISEIIPTICENLKGWHVPTMEDWKEFRDFLETCNKDVYNQLIKIGFDPLLIGSYDITKYTRNEFPDYRNAYYWSSSMASRNTRWYFYIGFQNYTHIDKADMNYGMNIRLFKDKE